MQKHSPPSSHGNPQVCRICYSTGDLQSLITPCDCSGTMGILHQQCLERWLEISNTSKCEICQHEYEVIRYPKSLLYVSEATSRVARSTSSLWCFQFLTNPLRPSDVRYLINDLLLFIFLTAIIGWQVPLIQYVSIVEVSHLGCWSSASPNFDAPRQSLMVPHSLSFRSLCSSSISSGVG